MNQKYWDNLIVRCAQSFRSRGKETEAALLENAKHSIDARVYHHIDGGFSFVSISFLPDPELYKAIEASKEEIGREIFESLVSLHTDKKTFRIISVKISEVQ